MLCSRPTRSTWTAPFLHVLSSGIKSTFFIHARSGSTTYALAYILLPERQIDTYCRLFSQLKTKVRTRLNLTLDPATVQIDFELAAIRAVEREFPKAEVKGCYFHYCQALWRKVQNLGLAVQGRSSLQQWIRRAAGLALLPHNEVQDAWIEAMDSTPNVPRAQEFNDYMIVNWTDYDARSPCRSGTTMRPMGHAPTTI